MSTTCEVPFEPLAFDGSNYPSWHSNVLIALKVLGPTIEGVILLWLRVSFRRMRLVSYQRNWRRSDSMPLLLTFCVAVSVVN
jgi:hypothetical protein